MGRPTKPHTPIRIAENLHIQFILDRALNSSVAAAILGITLRSIYIRDRNHEIDMMKFNPPSPGHFLSDIDMTLEDFKASLIRHTLKETGSIVKTATILGTSSKTVTTWMGEHKMERPKRIKLDRVSDKPITEKDLPMAMVMRNKDRPVQARFQKEAQEVSVWVDPEERDHYYNLDFPWGSYSRSENGRLTHALGYGEDE